MLFHKRKHSAAKIIALAYRRYLFPSASFFLMNALKTARTRTICYISSCILSSPALLSKDGSSCSWCLPPQNNLEQGCWRVDLTPKCIILWHTTDALGLLSERTVLSLNIRNGPLALAHPFPPEEDGAIGGRLANSSRFRLGSRGERSDRTIAFT